jgi:Ca2+-binding RTX toxin-like protein
MDQPGPRLLIPATALLLAATSAVATPVRATAAHASVAATAPASAPTSLTNVGGLLRYRGTDADDVVTIVVTRQAYRVTAAGGLGRVVGCERISARAASCPSAGVHRVVLRLRGASSADGNRLLVRGAPGARGDLRAFGGRQSDRVTNRSGLGVFFLGHAGDDVFVGGPGGDFAHGGAGADTLWGGRGADSVLGARGPDLLHGGAPDVTDPTDGRDHVDGGPGDDVIDGDDGPDRVITGPGDDRATGDDGDDRVLGNDGDDRVAGGRGDDRVRGGHGADRVEGHAGSDVLYGDEGPDTIDSRDSDADDVNCGAGVDTLTRDWRDLAYLCEHVS